MSALINARRAAARQAIHLVRKASVIGLGSGSTMALAVAEISTIIEREEIKPCFIPTSYQIERVAISHGLRIVSLNDCPEPDLAIDGADQVDDGLNLIKGGGAALTREKIVAAAAKRFVVIVDEQKKSRRLSRGVPLEVLAFAHEVVVRRIVSLGGKATIREGTGKVGPIITDNGNFILDADFGSIDDPKSLDDRLRHIPGVVETGLFTDMVDEVYVGRLDGAVDILRRNT